MTGIVLHIGIASREQMKARTLSVARGDFRPGPDDPKVWFASIESLAQILSTSNQRLLELIRRLKPQSMAELAKASGREESNLSRTLHTMERYRLVRLNKAARGRIVPEILYDRLTFDLPIAAGAAFAAAPAQPSALTRDSDMCGLAAFILDSKRRTYAGSDDAATVIEPLLRGSKQLEHRAGRYAYRDIYFGMGFFVGQETVSENERIIWSMCYSGGVRPEISDRTRLLSIYEFLRRALLAATPDKPYRGPVSFAAGDMVYLNDVEGSLDRFHGAERISEHGSTLFELRYGGGLVR